MTRSNLSNCLLPLLLLLAGAFLLYSDISSSSGAGNIAAAQRSFSLPVTLLVIWIGLAGLLLVQSLVKLKVSSSEPRTASPVEAGKLIAVAIITLATGIGTVYLGYLVPVTIGIAAFLLAVGERNPVRLALGIFLFGPGLWFLFHHILLIRLPSLISADLF